MSETGGGYDEDETPLQNLVAGGVTFVTLAVAFGLMALDQSYFWIAFPVGFGGGLPLAMALVHWYESREADDRPGETGDDETDAALAELRERYARGELTDAEFETRVERLLETESVADAKSYAERERRTADRARRADDGEGVGERSDGERPDEDREPA